MTFRVTLPLSSPMSGLRNSTFGKRLRASQQEPDDDRPPTNRQRTDDDQQDYGDRFIPTRDAGDMRTSYNLKDDAGPSTPSKKSRIVPRIIPSESDALKGMSSHTRRAISPTPAQSRQMPFSTPFSTQRSPHQTTIAPRPPHGHSRSPPPARLHQLPPAAAFSSTTHPPLPHHPPQPDGSTRQPTRPTP